MRILGRGARGQWMLVAMVAALVAVVGVGSATAEKPVTVEVGELRLKFNGTFSPKALPKKKLAPITLTASGKIEKKDGGHPPALKEVILETDKNGAVKVTGLPACKSGKLQSRDTKAALSEGNHRRRPHHGRGLVPGIETGSCRLRPHRL